MRSTAFVSKEFYHIYNRGVEKRVIFEEPKDLLRFLQCIKEFNTVEPIGSLYQNSFRELRSPTSKLVNIIAYCLNQNHYHFILEPTTERGIEKFMQRLSTGYTNYFNYKNKRSGVLFQGKYKAKHISSNEYLIQLGVYVNLNDRVHDGMNKPWMKKLPFSSFKEYTELCDEPICTKDILLGQFKNSQEFTSFCEGVLTKIQKLKKDLKEFGKVCID